MKYTERDSYVDFLRFLGLSLIIFAHVSPPPFLFQLRNFDVPLMVIVSALSFSLSGHRDAHYKAYVWARIKRLVFPVWCFLTLFFLTHLIFNQDARILSTTTILQSYSFNRGIGYVWIIRVFLLVALVAPLIYRFHKRVRSNTHYFSCLALMYISYELLLYLVQDHLGSGWFARYIFSDLVLYIIPYAFIFALGLRLTILNAQQVFVLMILFLIFLLLFCGTYLIEGVDVPSTQKFKYPPSSYYLYYALFACLLVWLSAGKVWSFFSKSVVLRMLVLFIASNSLWIYLWHIPFAEYIDLNFAVKYLLVYTGAVIIAFGQYLFVQIIMLPRVRSEAVRKNIQAVFTG